jgi:flagellar export protein FliJ
MVERRQRSQPGPGRVDNPVVPMRSFRFQLESVRALTEHAEGSARLDLAGEIAAGLAAGQELDTATALLEDARRVLPLADGSEVSAWDLLATDAYLQRRETSRAAAAEALLLQERRIEAKRALLLEASRRRQTLERLKLRRKAAHRTEQERAELAYLNEVSLLLHDRRTRDAL